MYGNKDNMVNAILKNRERTLVTTGFANEIVRKDMNITLLMAHLVETHL